MTAAHLKSIALLAVAWPVAALAQARTVGVCEALNSSSDHQDVAIRATLALTRHGAFLIEGTGRDPCPGWPPHLFTAPSAIPLFNGSNYGVRVADSQVRKTLGLFVHLRNGQGSDTATHRVVTASGVLIRKTWLLVFRSSDGTYCCGGVGPDGGYAALLVVKSVLGPDR